MSDTSIIWKFLMREYPDTHPAVIQHSNEPRGSMVGVEYILNNIRSIFSPPMGYGELEDTVIQYLDFKRKEKRNYVYK